MGQSTPYFHLNPAELSGVAKDLHSLAEQLQSGVVGLDNQISELIGGSWSGDASSAYGKVWQQWHQGARGVVSGLALMSGLLAKSAKAFAAQDGSAADADQSGVT